MLHKDVVSEDGFTFIEALVAFAILFLSLGVAYQASNTNLRAQTSAKTLQTMKELAEEQFAYIHASKYIEERDQTYENNGFSWTVKIVRQGDGAQLIQGKPALFNVTLEIQTINNKASKTWHSSYMKIVK